MQACLLLLSPEFSFNDIPHRLLPHTLEHAVLAVQCGLSCFTYRLQGQLIVLPQILLESCFPRTALFFLSHYYKGFKLLSHSR